MKANHKSILRKLHIAQGQLKGIDQMIQEDRYCIDIIDQLSASIALLKSCAEEVLKAHIEHCVSDTIKDAAAQEKVQEAIRAISRLGDL